MLTVELERLALVPGASVLDLGCGGGRHAYACMRAGATVVALDADGDEVSEVAAMMAALEEDGGVSTGNAVVRGDALRLPFADGTFDRVICAEILEHIADDRAAMAEVARVVRPGGVVAVTVPRYSPELINWTLSREYHSVPGGHIRIYRRGQLVGRLREAGLAPVGSHHAHALHSPYWWLRCIVGTTRDDHPLVRAYHRLLVFDITSGSPLTRIPERLLNPLIGKSLVVYLEKRAAA
jgi:SAM-dependent methyltransferase